MDSNQGQGDRIRRGRNSRLDRFLRDNKDNKDDGYKMRRRIDRGQGEEWVQDEEKY